VSCGIYQVVEGYLFQSISSQDRVNSVKTKCSSSSSMVEVSKNIPWIDKYGGLSQIRSHTIALHACMPIQNLSTEPHVSLLACQCFDLTRVHVAMLFCHMLV
jgi:hypothetical protein